MLPALFQRWQRHKILLTSFLTLKFDFNPTPTRKKEMFRGGGYVQVNCPYPIDESREGSKHGAVQRVWYLRPTKLSNLYDTRSPGICSKSIGSVCSSPVVSFRTFQSRFYLNVKQTQLLTLFLTLILHDPNRNANSSPELISLRSFY